MALSLGISPCPNDTYIFSALIGGRIPLPAGFGPLSARMADVEELNALAREGRLDVTKMSAAAAAHVLDEYVILNAGAALGRGCGPLLAASSPVNAADLADAAIAVPGRLTTANLLLSLHGGFHGPRAEMPFDRIMPALAAGECAAGVIIHEGRFTYAANGLSLVLDLGEWWERATGSPIPLGVIVARRSLGLEMLKQIDRLIRASLEQANADPGATAAFVRAHAQEMDEDVCARHIKTFVNENSLDLGGKGRAAVRRLIGKAAELNGLSLPRKPLFVERFG